MRRPTSPVILTEAARQENEIASRVQSSILPGEIDVQGLAILCRDAASRDRGRRLLRRVIPVENGLAGHR